MTAISFRAIEGESISEYRIIVPELNATISLRHSNKLSIATTKDPNDPDRQTTIWETEGSSNLDLHPGYQYFSEEAETGAITFAICEIDLDQPMTLLYQDMIEAVVALIKKNEDTRKGALSSVCRLIFECLRSTEIQKVVPNQIILLIKMGLVQMLDIIGNVNLQQSRARSGLS